MERENTFGEYTFPDWVPEHTQEIIRNFWGQMGRTHKDWLDNVKQAYGEAERCEHGPGPNGFRNPPNGARAFYFIRMTGKEDEYKRIEGRYLHRWNNMGSLIDDKGEDHTVSSCDPWIRVFQEKETLI